VPRRTARSTDRWTSATTAAHPVATSTPFTSIAGSEYTRHESRSGCGEEALTALPTVVSAWPTQKLLCNLHRETRAQPARHRLSAFRRTCTAVYAAMYAMIPWAAISGIVRSSRSRQPSPAGSRHEPSQT
jgi:hypothetical protein